MKAAIYYGAKDFRVENIAKPRIEPTDVLIRVRCCGICGSDLHTYKRGIFGRPGFIMGHEIAGEAVEIGTAVEGIKVGDHLVPDAIGDFSKGCGRCYWCLRVQPQWCPSNAHKPCSQCADCKSGQFWLCEKLQRHMDIGYSRNGGYAEYAYIPDAVLGLNVHKVPDSMSWEEAAFVEPTAGAYRWVGLADPKPFETAVVIGLGTIGLLVMQVLKTRVSKVIVCEVSQKRLRLAKELGADVTIDATKEDPVQRIIDLTGTGRTFTGRGGGCVDIVEECSGAPLALRQAIEMTRTGGRIVMVGLAEEEIPLNINHVIHKQISLISSFLPGKQSAAQTWKDSIQLIADGKVKVRPLISHEFPLDQIMPAFEIQARPDESVKVLINP